MEATHSHGARARGGMPRQSRGGKSWRAAGAGVLLACALGPAPAAAWTVIPAVSGTERPRPRAAARLAAARAADATRYRLLATRLALCVRGPGAARLCLTAGGAGLAPQDARPSEAHGWRARACRPAIL